MLRQCTTASSVNYGSVQSSARIAVWFPTRCVHEEWLFAGGSDKVVGKAAEDFAGNLGGDDLAELAGVLRITAERDVAAAADHELVVAGAVLALLRRAGAELHAAAIAVGFDHADRLQQVGQLRGKRLADLPELFQGGAGQFGR